ncbi:MAG: Rieske (2Fe-2S) protein [Candidatus Obscuribacterales bacterium]|nr:Rieske (2Fe-2S) protein [Candidatus Obscuribacterales bacterium]
MEEDKKIAEPETIEKSKCGGANHPCGECPNSTEHQSDSEDETVDRAQFIKTAFAGVTACWGVMALAPVVMYLNPPQSNDDDKTKITSLEVCKLSELPPGTGRNFRFGSVPALIIHTEDGVLHAFKAICTHLGCTVQFRPDKQNIYCACHGGQYDAHTGKNIAGPPPKPLSELKAEIVDGKIIVSRA